MRQIARAILTVLIGTLACATASAQSPLAKLTPGDLARGRQLFVNQCGRCHGASGGGGEGPSLTRATLRRAPDDAALLGVIKGGIPGTGMPIGWQMNDTEIAQVAGYVRELGRVPPAVVPGDAARGRNLYAANACATCHIVRGQGRGVGPELSDIGARRGVPYLREALVDPGAALPVGSPAPFSAGGYIEFMPIRIVSRDGQEVVGMRVNEDTFTIQVRDAGNRFRSFRKQELKVLERQPNRSLMPSYRERLSASQLDDVTAYLYSLRGQP